MWYDYGYYHYAFGYYGYSISEAEAPPAARGGRRDHTAAHAGFTNAGGRDAAA